MHFNKKDINSVKKLIIIQIKIHRADDLDLDICCQNHDFE